MARLDAERVKSFLGRSSQIRNAHRTYRKLLGRSYRRAHNVFPNHVEFAATDVPIVHGGDQVNASQRIASGDYRLVPHPDVTNPVLEASDVHDALATFVADPFVVYEDGVYHMFFEIKDKAREVYIAHAHSYDGLDYSYNGIVIPPETAQHTYPLVFKHNGEWLMAPSPGPGVKGEFRIYRAKDFPMKWELVDTPITTGVRQDPTPFVFNETWYVIYQDRDSLDIELYRSDDLIGGDWQEHPKSPIFRNDEETLRECPIGPADFVPSGRPIVGDDGVDIFYRVHTEEELHHYRISDLSENQFNQRLVKSHPLFVRHDGGMWNERFMHTINPVYPLDHPKNVIAVDGLEAERYKWSIGIYTAEDP